MLIKCSSWFELVGSLLFPPNLPDLRAVRGITRLMLEFYKFRIQLKHIDYLNLILLYSSPQSSYRQTITRDIEWNMCTWYKYWLFHLNDKEIISCLNNESPTKALISVIPLVLLVCLLSTKTSRRHASEDGSIFVYPPSLPHLFILEWSLAYWAMNGWRNDSAMKL